MSLKRKLDKATWEKLSEEFKAAYEEKDGNYVLSVEGDDDVGEMKRAKDREVQLRKDAEKEARELKAKLDEITGDDAKKRGDVELLEKSYKEKMDKQKKEYEEKLTQRESFIKSTLIDAKALELASEISNSPVLLLPHIKARLTADLEGETPVTKIMDAKGNISALTMDDLKKEFVANKDFSSIIIGSKAKGSGADDGSKQTETSGANSNADKPKSLSAMSPKEMKAYLDSQKT